MTHSITSLSVVVAVACVLVVQACRRGDVRLVSAPSPVPVGVSTNVTLAAELNTSRVDGTGPILLKATLTNNSTNEVRVTVQCVPIVTKGFPCIAKITVLGPGFIPAVSLYDDTLPIRVTFRAVDTSRTFTVCSSRGMDIAVTTPDGERRESDNQDMWQTCVENGKRQSVLVDLASIRPEVGRGTLFDDLEPGEYDVTVLLFGGDPTSNTIRLRIVAPNADEAIFLGEILRQGSFSLGKGVNWSKALRYPIRIPSDTRARLTSVTKAQTAFHMLLVDLLASGNVLGPDDEDAVKATPLPKFIEPERECLLNEVTVASGHGEQAETARLAGKYPDLEWRLQGTVNGSGDFLRYKKATVNRD